MHLVSQGTISEYIAQADMAKSVRRKLKPQHALKLMSQYGAANLELLAVSSQSRLFGVLLVELQSEVFAIAYEFTPRLPEAKSGRLKPVICDLCKTWQSGTRIGTITFNKNRRPLNSISYYCCADLLCSLHVRSLTAAAAISRANLREDVENSRRIERFTLKLAEIVSSLDLKPTVVGEIVP